MSRPHQVASKGSDIGERRQGSVARFRVARRVDRLNADLSGTRSQMRPQAAGNRRRIWGTASVRDLAVEVGAVPASPIRQVFTSRQASCAGRNSLRARKPVDLWTTRRSVAHKPTGPTTAADNLNLEISSVRTTPGSHSQAASYDLFRHLYGVLTAVHTVGCNEETACQAHRDEAPDGAPDARRRSHRRRRQDHQSLDVGSESRRTNLVRSHTSTSWPSRNSKALAIAS